MNFKAILWTYEPKHDGSCAVKIRLSEGAVKKYHNLKHYVIPKDWNEKKGRVLDRRLNCDKINAEIASALGKFEAIHLENRSLSVESVIDLFKGGKTKENLLDFINGFIDSCKAGEIKRSHGTIKAYRVTYNNLTKFRDSGARVDFNSINQDFYLKWTAWMRQEKKDIKGIVTKIAFSESTVGKEVKHLKVFLNQAIEMGISKNTEHQKKAFKVVGEDSDTIYLNEQETTAFIALNVPEHLNIEKERYIVAYYLLLRFSDSMNIIKSKIVSNQKGNFIKTKAIKTGENIMVPIKPIVWEILKKHNFAFPVSTNQECNKKLKELGQLAGLDEYITTCSTVGGQRKEATQQKWELLTTHTARRSGATNLLKAGVPENIIMAMGGWKTRSSFMRYIRIGVEENAELAMKYDFFK